MIQASNAYKDAVNGNGRMVRARLYINGEPLDEPIGEVKFYRGCCGQKPDAGSIYVPYIDATIKGAVTASGNATLKAQVGFLTESDWEWVDVGNYVISRIDAQSDSVTIRGVGTLGTVGSGKANVTESTYAGIANEIATATGIDVQFVGVDSSGSFENPPEGKYRDILAQIAYNLGGFLSESADGKWTIAGFCSGTAITVDPSRMQTPPSYGSESYSLNGVQVESAEIDLSMGNPLIDPWDYLVFGEDYARLDVNRTTGNLIAENSEAITGTIAFDDDADGHLLYTYTDGVNVSFNVSNGHLFANQPNAHIVPCLQITHTLNGGCSTFIGAHVESAVEEEATIQGPLNRQVVEANEKATQALESVQETANYFWANEEGAHVTEKTKAEFIANPANGGWNTLVQARGMTIRDGLTERMIVAGDGFRLNDNRSTQMFNLTSSEASSQKLVVEKPEQVMSGEWNFSSVPIEGRTENNLVFKATKNGEENTGVISVSIPSSGTYTEMATFPTAGTAEISIEVDFETYSIKTTAPSDVSVTLQSAQYMANIVAPLFTYGSRAGGKGAYSATFGEGLIADYPSQFVVGQYNENISDDLFEIGGGSSDDNRKTLFAVEASGDVYAAGYISAAGQIVAQEYKCPRVSWSAGTAGTWAYQQTVNIAMDGYDIICACPRQCGHPSAYLFNFYVSGTNGYFNFFRSNTAAYTVPANDATGIVFYKKKHELE